MKSAFLGLVVAGLLWSSACGPAPAQPASAGAAGGAATPRAELEPLPARILHTPTGMVLIRVEPGSFTMGTPPWEDRRDGDEAQREATIRAPFLLGETEVTVGQWRRVMHADPPIEQANDQEPVMGVSWHAAMLFVERLNDTGRGGWRLPSEAEWEFACRAGTTTPFSFGEELSPDLANYDGRRPYAGAARGLNRETVVPVRTFPPNPWGFYEMHGNVWEWCSDFYLVHPGRDRESDDPGASRSMRGGAYTSMGEQLRSGYRDGYPPKSLGEKYGFRIARSVE